MQLSARYNAVLELTEEIFKDKSPADGIINAYLRERKYIGSGDRRFIAETVWKIIRHRRRLEFEAQSSDPRRILLVYLKDEDLDLIFGAGEYAPTALSKEERNWLKKINESVYPPDVEAECPRWLFDKVEDMALLKSLNEPASADLRVNRGSRESVLQKLRGEGLYFAPTPYSPIGIRSSERVNLNNCIAYREGEIEVQDEASQLAAILCDVRPQHKIMDYCCGAGGKSLALAYLMDNQGKVLAHDISAARLEAIKPRMQRLGIKNIELTDFAATTDRDFDRFILDAPCSGSGTWRRSPDAKFRLTPEYLEKLNQTQRELLDIAYDKTKSGGRIIYITCSIFKDENENIVEPFVKAHGDVRLLNLRELWEQKLKAPYPCVSNEYLRLSPLATGTDGFFLAIIEKV